MARPEDRQKRGAGGNPPRRPASASPEPDEMQERLTELYKEMSVEELTRQGRSHLAGDTRAKALRSVHLGWVVCWTMIVGGLILIGVFTLWLLFMARKSGTSFAHMRQQAMSAYTNDE